MINPSIWEDPDFNRLSHQARLLFIGIISNSDDEGYIRGDSGSLKRLIFGFDEIKIEQIKEWIKELSKMKNIHFYDFKEETYAHLLNWSKYQKQQKDRIIPTIYPMCSKCLSNDKQPLAKEKRREEKISVQGTEHTLDLIKYFLSGVKERYGVEPAINYARDGKLVKMRLKTYGDDKVKKIIDFFLDDKKCDKFGFNLSVALSTDTINKYLKENESYVR